MVGVFNPMSDDQIAREAARSIIDRQMHRNLIEDVAYGIILAAIEKARDLIEWQYSGEQPPAMDAKLQSDEGWLDAKDHKPPATDATAEWFDERAEANLIASKTGYDEVYDCAVAAFKKLRKAGDASCPTTEQCSRVSDAADNVQSVPASSQRPRKEGTPTPLSRRFTSPFRCPVCDAKTCTIDTRKIGSGKNQRSELRRRRVCANQHRFTTYETATDDNSKYRVNTLEGVKWISEAEKETLMDAVMQPAASQRPTRNCGENAGEWTPEDTLELMAFGQKAVADAHNAAIADIVSAAQMAATLHKQQLAAAEREKSTEWATNAATEGAKNIELKTQLLQAQAAIAEHNERWSVYEGEGCEITVEPSALDKHDAEVREERDKWWRERTSSERVLRLENELKLLVEALENVRSQIRLRRLVEAIQICNDVLAKVKP